MKGKPAQTVNASILFRWPFNQHFDTVMVSRLGADGYFYFEFEITRALPRRKPSITKITEKEAKLKVTKEK